ncbi:MAG: DUF488 domain-containing protein [bacterium]
MLNTVSSSEAEAVDRRPIAYTIGHSNHPSEFLRSLLKQFQIDLLVDLRSHPYSKYAVQYNRETLQQALRGEGIDYRGEGQTLGGLPQDEEFYDAEGYVLYGEIAKSPAFRAGILRLLRLIQEYHCVLMCSEENPAACHRHLLISRVLSDEGIRVLHIRGTGEIEEEDQLRAEERRQQMTGQATLFDLEEEAPWRSIQSVSPIKARRNSLGS